MKVTSGHDCFVKGCAGLAMFGMTYGGETKWVCRPHQHVIGFRDRPAAPFCRGAAEAGQEAGAPALPPPAFSRFPQQGSLL